MRLLPWDYGIRNLARSPLQTCLGVTGAALVVLLVVAAAAFVRGMGRTLGGTADDRNVILLSAGSDGAAERSELDAGVAAAAAAAVPSVAASAGAPHVSPEIHAALSVERTPGDPDPFLASFRGVTDGAWLVHRAARIAEGRAPSAGEVVVGRLAAARAGLDPADLAVGRTIRLDGADRPIVGILTAPGTVMDAEIWCPLEDLRLATRRSGISCVILTLAADADFSDVELMTRRRLDLAVTAVRERDYYASLFAYYGPVRAMVWATAGLVALGAFLGGLNTAYASFASRIRELATLQTLGFPRRAIVTSLVQESLVQSAAGGLAAVAIGAALLDGRAVRISMGAFGLVVDEVVVAAGLGAAVALGVLGTIPPAVRCLRRPVAEALRAI